MDTITINITDSLGVAGTLLASPPGSCSGVPDGFIGDCTNRAAAALEAWVDGNFSHGTNWNELENAFVVGTIDRSTNLAIIPPTLENPTDIGTSWIPEYCNQPSCGHLLKGDVLFVDENGDDVFDETWYDDNNNGIRDNGEVDRIRSDQFGWGATSTITDFSRIGGPTDLQIVTNSGITPPGLSRARVRVALGDDWDCVIVTNPDCTLDGIPGVPDPTGLLTATPIDDNELFGYCDPDKFIDLLAIDLASVQRQLDNCLWKVGATPVTAPRNSSVTGEGLAIRETWMDQRIIKYTASSIPDRQDFIQNWLQHVGFERIDPSTGDLIPIDEAPHQNGLVIEQSGRDPEPTVNLSSTPDAYPSAFRLQHTTLARGYGKDFSGLPVGPDTGDTPLDSDLIGKTNPTDDPFWGADSGPLGFDTDMNTNAKSGVGRATGFKFMYVQEVEGFLASCLNCGEGHDVTIPGGISYDQVWPQIPDILIGNHPPQASESFIIVPNP